MVTEGLKYMSGINMAKLVVELLPTTRPFAEGGIFYVPSARTFSETVNEWKCIK